MIHRLAEAFEGLPEDEDSDKDIFDFWGGLAHGEACEDDPHFNDAPVSAELSPSQEDWRPSFSEAVASFFDTVERRLRRTTFLKVLEDRVAQLESSLSCALTGQSVVAPIASFDPEPFEALKEIKVVIEQADEEEFIATFFDGNVSAGGCNPQEAFDNLKENLLSRFDFLDKTPLETLGPPLQKQLSILRKFIARSR